MRTIPSRPALLHPRRTLAALLTLLLACALAVVSAGTARAAAGGSISGTVTDKLGTPLVGIDVQVYDYDAGTGTSTPYGGSVETDASGHYLLQAIPAGTHKVRFSDPMNLKYATTYWHDQPSAELGDAVAVADSTTTPNVNEALDTGGEVRGVVRDVSLAPVSGITVQPYLKVGNAWKPTEPTQTSPAGGYRLTGLMAGTYRVSYTDTFGRGFVTQWADDAPDAAHAAFLDVANSGLQTHDITLSKKSTIYGSITDGASPLANVGVTLYDVSTDTPTYVDSTTSGPVGEYAFHEVVAGSYKVVATDVSGTYQQASSDELDILDPPHGIPDVDIAMQPAASPEQATTPPSITGTAAVGKVLHAVPASWADTTTGTSYQWALDGHPVSGATGTTFTLPAAALGKKVTVTEAATATGHSAGTSTSAATAKVVAGTISCAHLGTALTGRDKVPNVGEVARVVATCAGAKIGVQWYLGTAVPGRAGHALALGLGKKAKGKRLAVRVTVSRTGYRTVVKTFGLGKVGKKKRHR